MSRTRVLTDEMWARIEPLLPDRTPQRGGRWIEHRPVLEAICWRFRTGSPWRDIPPGFPAWQTVWPDFRRSRAHDWRDHGADLRKRRSGVMGSCYYRAFVAGVAWVQPVGAVKS